MGCWVGGLDPLLALSAGGEGISDWLVVQIEGWCGGAKVGPGSRREWRGAKATW